MFGLLYLSLSLLQERHVFDTRSLAQIDPLPHTKELIKEEKYSEAKEYLEYFLQFSYVQENPESEKLMQYINEKRDSLSYKTDKILEGIFEGKSDENIGRAAAIASDFLIIGDIRDLSIEGANYANDREVDQFIVALSSLGLLATASTIYSLGASTPIKSSISILKHGKRSNKIPVWFQNSLIKQIEHAKTTKSLHRVEDLLKPIQTLYKKVGLNSTLQILSQARNLNHLKQLTKFSSRFTANSRMLLKTTNNKALFYSSKMPKVSNQNLLYASSYGENGLKGMYKLGESKFMKKVGFSANLSKTTYKGNFNALLDAIPNNLLFVISFIGLFYFMLKLYRLRKLLF
jgi:hypothetical protein